MSAPTAATLEALGRMAARAAADSDDDDDAAEALVCEVHADTDRRRAELLAGLARIGAGALVAAVREAGGRAS